MFVPTVEAPRFYRGYRAGLAASLALTSWTPVVWFFTRRQKLQERRVDGVAPSEESSQGGESGGMDVGDLGESKQFGAVGLRERQVGTE